VTLQEACAVINRPVIYVPRVGEPEEGIVTAVNTAYVFVRYGNDQHSKATRPEDLEVVAGPLLPPPGSRNF